MQCSCSCLSICLSTYRLIYLSFCLSICLSIDLSIYLCIYLSIDRSIYLSASLKAKLFCEASSIFELDNVKNEAIQRDFLNFQVGNIKNEAILQDFLQKWKVECRADGLVPMCFAIFPLHLSKVLGLPRKSDARSYEVLRLSRKIILANLKISCSKMQLLSGNLRPDLLTHLTHVSLVLRLPREMHLSRSSSNVPRLPSCWTATKPSRFAHFSQGTQSPAPARQNDIWMFKSAPYPSVFGTFCNGVHFFDMSTSKSIPKLRCLYMLTWKCASRHNGVNIFHMSTSKSGPGMVCFVHFDFEMCAAPQGRATFHLSSGQMAPTFRPSRATNHWKKHSEYRLFYLFPHLHLLSSDSFSSLLFSDASHLCFSSVHIVGSWLLNFLR